MKKIIDYLFYRYYLISIKKEESPRFGATCVLAEVVTMVYLFAVLILSFLLTGDFFLPYTSGRTRIIIGIIGCFLPWPVIYLHYNKKRINALVEKYQNNRYNTKYSDKAVLSLSYIVPTVGLILMHIRYSVLLISQYDICVPNRNRALIFVRIWNNSPAAPRYFCRRTIINH